MGLLRLIRKDKRILVVFDDNKNFDMIKVYDFEETLMINKIINRDETAVENFEELSKIEQERINKIIILNFLGEK